MQKFNVQENKLKKRFVPISLVSIIAAGLAIVACNDQASAKPNIVHHDAKDAPKPGVLAKIGGEEITEESLIGEDKVDFFDLKKREYELKMDRLNKLMVDKLVGAEAKKAGMSLDEFMTKKVTKGDIKISTKDYDNFVKEKRIPETQINPQIKERINNYLQSQKKQEMVQAYVANLTKNNPVEVYFNKPKMEVKVDVGNAPIWGKGDVTIVEFSDFQCPFCSRGAEAVEALKKKYGEKKIKIAFKEFPLPMHQQARPAAEAALCVNDQGAEKFWKFHDLAFKNQEKLDNDSLSKYAKDVGADVGKFSECLKAGKFKDSVQKDMDYGEKIGVRSTPTFFINGQLVSGAVPIEQFSEIIDDELENNKKK